jgi:hypothetical protein
MLRARGGVKAAATNVAIVAVRVRRSRFAFCSK